MVWGSIRFRTYYLKKCFDKTETFCHIFHLRDQLFGIEIFSLSLSFLFHFPFPKFLSHRFFVQLKNLYPISHLIQRCVGPIYQNNYILSATGQSKNYCNTQ
jgi:hypothetical protein